jgi:hypothetical protein
MGRGPGELQELDGFTTVGDTLVTVDGRLAVHVFAPNGDWLRSVILPPVPGYIVNPVIGALSASTVVQHLTAGQIDSTGGGAVRLDSIWLGRLSLRDTTVRVIAAQSRPPAYSARPGLRPTATFVFGPMYMASVRDGWLCLGYSVTYTIACVDSTGRPLIEIRRDIASRPVTESAKRAWRDLARTSSQRPRRGFLTRPVTEAGLASARFAETFPAFAQMLLSRTGELWIRQHPTDGTSRTSVTIRPSDWSIYDRQGRWIADCRLPARFALMDAGADFVIGVSRDEDDVERVTLLSLKR